jgi:helix-turn-helix protein
MGTDGPGDGLYGGLLSSGRADATVVRMLLGHQLRRLREAAGLTPEQAGHEIRASRAKISRMENGCVGFKARDVADLLTLYGVTSEQARTEMLDLARRASTPGWWATHSDILPDWFEAPLRRGEFNRDVADAQVSRAQRHAPGPGEQRQRCAVAGFDDRAQLLDRRRASLYQRRAQCGADAACLPVVGDGDGDVGGGRIAGVLQEMGDPDRPLLAMWRQHDQHERNVMHPVNAADKPGDHRVIESTGRGEEPVPARILRQAAEPLAQRLGIGGQQRPDHRRRTVSQAELPRQDATIRLSGGRTAQCHKAARLRLHVSCNAACLAASS